MPPASTSALINADRISKSYGIKPLLDEVSLGLAPKVIEELYAAVPAILATGLGAVIVEQDIGRALKVSHRFVTLREGQVVLEGPSRGADRHAITTAYFGAHA